MVIAEEMKMSEKVVFIVTAYGRGQLYKQISIISRCNNRNIYGAYNWGIAEEALPRL